MKGLLARHRAALLLGFLLLLGAVAGGIATVQDSANHGGPTLASRSADPTGALGLALWLERLGYQVDRLQTSGATPGDAYSLYFAIDTVRPFSRTEAGAVTNWVLRGGTLVLLPYPSLDDPLQRNLGIGIRYSSARIGGTCYSHPGCVDPKIQPAVAFFTQPPAARFSATSYLELQLNDDSWTPLVVQTGGSTPLVLVAMRQMGSGRVYAIADPSLLSNEGIDQADNAALVLNVLARVAGRRAIAFDEVHNGSLAGQDFLSAARESPWGWTIAYLAVVGFFFAIWGGRRFGPAVVPETPPGRSGGDYVTAFAGLLRRQKDAPAWAQRQLGRLARRHLIRRYGLPADLTTEELVSVVSERQGVEAVDLDFALHALAGRPLDEKTVMKHLQTIDRWLGERTW